MAALPCSPTRSKRAIGAARTCPMSLRSLVKGLLDKIERTQPTHDGHSPLGHIENRIAKLIEKLDASDARLHHLQDVERWLKKLPSIWLRGRVEPRTRPCAAAGAGRPLTRSRRAQANRKEDAGFARSLAWHAGPCRRSAGDDRDRPAWQGRASGRRPAPSAVDFARAWPGDDDRTARGARRSMHQSMPETAADHGGARAHDRTGAAARPAREPGSVAARGDNPPAVAARATRAAGRPKEQSHPSIADRSGKANFIAAARRARRQAETPREQ